MTIEEALEENTDTGLWTFRRLELEKEVRKRVPDFQVMVTLSQRNISAWAPASAPTTDMLPDQSQPGETARNALLSEAALRLMWLYHRSLPSLAVEARFDPGKLLLSLTSGINAGSPPGSPAIASRSNESPTSGLDALGQLHVLRLLQESDQFSWSAKLGKRRRCYMDYLVSQSHNTATTNHSHIHHILQLFTRTLSDPVRDAAGSLIIGTLSRSILFEHDPLEIYLWLMALPLVARSPTAQGPDGASLTDERDGVIAFLDNCIQLCLKSPYRYVEDALALLFTDDDEPATHRPDLAPSPLLMTVIEQFTVQQTSNVLTPSDTLALATFLRKFTMSLTSKHADLRHTERVSRRVLEVLDDPISVKQYPALAAGVSRERRLLMSNLQRFHSFSVLPPTLSLPRSQNIAVQDFLNTVENSQPGEGEICLPYKLQMFDRLSDEMTAQWSAAELIDWVRLVDQPLSTDDVLRLIDIIERWSRNSFVLREFFFHVEPIHHGLLSVMLTQRHAGGPVSSL